MKNAAFSTLLIAATLLTAACSSIEPTVSGGVVRVSYDGDVRGCRDAGLIAVTVADKIWFHHRNEIKVADELETMARNEAANIPADTIMAVTEPKDGSQRFHAYVCGHVQVRERGKAQAQNPNAPSTGPEGVETFPVKEH